MKRRLRIITYAWGRQYVENLLDITLAAVLAPGNLPALIDIFECEFVLLTEEALFLQIEKHPIYRKLSELAECRLLPIDDLLIAPLYGLTLTWATYRAMEDLGDAVVETDFMFFTADWIPADGSYRSLIPHLLNRERLIVAPSYCVISEKVLPLLRERIDPDTGVLTVSKREMAAIGIPNRHNTIRGKTINSHLFHMDIIEQFYWLVDSNTLLGHQMPIAIVCMRPERWIPEPNTFWDYGTVSALCPDVEPCVLGDSDDFLMIELRSESTYDDGLRIGWPDNSTIGQKLAGFVTRDHTVYGRHQLVLHSADLPVNINEARTSLHQFVTEIFHHFEDREISYVKHPFWDFQSSLFEIARRGWKAGLGAGDHVLWSFGSKALSSILGNRLGQYESEVGVAWQALQDAIPSFKEQGGVEAYIGQRDPIIGQSTQTLETLRQALSVEEAIHQRDVALLRRDVSEFQQVLSESSRDLDYRYNKSIGAAPVFTTAVAEPGLGGDVRSRLLERILRVGRHHAMWAPLRFVLSAMEKPLQAPQPKILYISSEGLGRLLRYTPLLRFPRTQAATFTAAHMEAGDIPWTGWFDLCVLELDFQDLQRLRRMYDNIRPAMRPGGKFVAFYFHDSMGQFSGDSVFIRNVYPRCDYGRAYYSGSPESARALHCFHRVERRLRAVGSVSGWRAAFATLVAGELAIAASEIEASLEPDAILMPRPVCTALTIDIDA